MARWSSFVALVWSALWLTAAVAHGGHSSSRSDTRTEGRLVEDLTGVAEAFGPYEAAADRAASGATAIHGAARHLFADRPHHHWQRRLAKWFAATDGEETSGGKDAFVAGRRTRSGFIAYIKAIRERMQKLKVNDPDAYAKRLVAMGPKLQAYVEHGTLPFQLAGSSGNGSGAVGGVGGGATAGGSAKERFIAKLKRLFETTRARLAALKSSDPRAYAVELAKLRPRMKAYVETGEMPDFSSFTPRVRSGDSSIGGRAGLRTQRNDEVTRSRIVADGDDQRRLLADGEPLGRFRDLLLERATGPQGSGSRGLSRGTGGRDERHVGHMASMTNRRTRPLSVETVARLRQFFERTRERMLALKKSDPAEYAKALGKLRVRVRTYVETGQMPEFGSKSAQA